jgi:hypothetical protein
MTIADIPAPIPTGVADDVLAGGVAQDVRDERLESGAAALEHRGGGSVLLQGRVLVVVAGALMTGGVVAILLGWLGASRSILVSEQVPYLISGGLLGLALATIGALTYFTHWLTVLVRDGRAQHAELVRLLQEERARDQEALVEAIRELRREERPIRRAPRGS